MTVAVLNPLPFRIGTCQPPQSKSLNSNHLTNSRSMLTSNTILPAASLRHSEPRCASPSNYLLCFDTLVHTSVRQKSQLLSSQSLPNTWSQNTRGGIPFIPFIQTSSQRTSLFSLTASHSLHSFVTPKPVSPLLATHTKSTGGVHPLPSKISATHASNISPGSYFSICTICQSGSRIG
jgi:hypothetical protein